LPRTEPTLVITPSKLKPPVLLELVVVVVAGADSITGTACIVVVFAVEVLVILFDLVVLVVFFFVI
jgi:hypothetical protein